MTGMTPEDQARLVDAIRDIRNQIDSSYSVIHVSKWAATQIVAALDAATAGKPDGEMVTRAKYDEMIDAHRDDLIAVNGRMEAAELERDEAITNGQDRIAELLAEVDTLRVALTAAEGALQRLIDAAPFTWERKMAVEAAEQLLRPAATQAKEIDDDQG